MQALAGKPAPPCSPSTETKRELQKARYQQQPVRAISFYAIKHYPDAITEVGNSLRSHNNGHSQPGSNQGTEYRLEQASHQASGT